MTDWARFLEGMAAARQGPEGPGSHMTVDECREVYGSCPMDGDPDYQAGFDHAVRLARKPK